MLIPLSCLSFASAGAAGDQSNIPAPVDPREHSPLVVGEQGVSFQKSRTYDLPGLIELSLCNNPYTRAAWFRVMASRASVGVAKSSYYPTINVIASGGYSQIPYPTQSGPLSVNSLSISPGIQLEYLLLDFGRRKADVRRTVALLQAANLESSRKFQEVLYAVQQSYFAHTAAISQQQAAESNLKLSQTINDMVQAQLSSGLATQPELLLAQKTLSQAKFDLSVADRNANVTLGNLRTAAGLDANAPIRISSPSRDVSLRSLSSNVDKLIEQALAKRPDLAARMADVRASSAATDRARAEFLPKLALEGNYNSYSFGFHAKQGDTAATSFGNYNQAGGFLVMSWDLFDGFERVEKVKKRQAEESEARANAETTRLTATRDVWTVYNDSLKSRQRVEYADSLLDSAKANLDSTQASFQNGLATITELLSSQSALTAALFERAGAEADYLTSLASLSLAMGESAPNIGTGKAR